MRRKARLPLGPLPVLGVLLALALGSPALAPSVPPAVAGPALKRADAETANLTAVIDGPGPTVDIGVAFTLSASLGDAIGPFVYIWTCAAIGMTHAATWTVRLTQPGPQRFGLEVGDAGGDVAWANATVNATIGPILAAGPTNATADIGVGTGVAFTIADGVPPYRLAWWVVGGGSAGTTTISTATEVVEPVWTNATGPVWVSANVTDAVGGTDAASTWAATAYPSPHLTAVLEPPVGEVGTPVHVVCAIAGGVPPIRWTVSAAADVRNRSVPNGTLRTDGTFQWNATVANAGTFGVAIAATDAVGVSASANLTVTVVPPINLSLVLPNATAVAGARLNASALVGGGVAPYGYVWTLTDGARSSGILAQPGPINWSVAAGPGGFESVGLTVRDAAGGGAAANVSLLVVVLPAAPAVPPPPAGDGGLAASALVLVPTIAAGVVGYGLWRRRRGQRGRATEREASADAFVAEALRGRNGVDADDLQGLGDAQAFLPEEVDQAVDRQIATGRVHIEHEAGERVYHWVEPSPSAATARGSRVPNSDTALAASPPRDERAAEGP